MFRELAQSAAIPWRVGVDRQIEVLLITSTSTGQWIVPKGMLEPDMTPAASAANEAWEEAGALGEVDEEPIGVWRRTKWGRPCRVDVYALRVTEVLEDYPEAGYRERGWFSIDAASARVREPDLARLIAELGAELTAGR